MLWSCFAWRLTSANEAFSRLLFGILFLQSLRRMFYSHGLLRFEFV